MSITPVDELIESTIEEIEGVDSLADFNKEALLADVADTPESSFGAGRVKEYTPNAAGLTSVKNDWGTSSKTYKAFAKINSQKKKPAKVQIIKRSAAVAEVQVLTFSQAVQSDETILGVVNGIAVSVAYETDSPTTLAALVTALEAIEGIASADLDTLEITITATSEWTVPVSLACDGNTNPTAIAVVASAGRTAADDINDALEDPVLNDWYLLTAAQDDKGLNLALMHNQEALGQGFFVAKTSESGIKTSNNSTNLGVRAAALNYKRTMIFMHQDMTEHINAAFGTYMAAVDAGGFQAAHRQLVGVTASPKSFLNPSEVTVVQSRNVNTYRRIGSKDLVEPGVRTDGKPAEMTKDLDYAKSKFNERIYAWMTAGDDTDYDDGGRIQLLGILTDTLDFLQNKGVARRDLPVTAEVTEFSEQDPANVTAGYFEAEVSFYYKRGVQKVILKIKSIDGGAQ